MNINQSFSNKSRKLIFNDPMTNFIMDKTNIFPDINLTVANIDDLTSKNIITTNINSTEGEIANISMNHDINKKISYITNLSDNLIIKNKNLFDLITISDTDGIIIDNDLNINGNVTINDGNFSGDINANNINLLGDHISTNARITNNFVVDNKITTDYMQITKDIQVDGFFTATNAVCTNLNINETFKSNNIQTSNIESASDLNLIAGINRSINIPNIRYNINIDNVSLIDPSLIKSFKIFIVSTNIIINSDETCNGIEIIIYNRNMERNIIIRNTTVVIDELLPQCSRKMAFVYAINKWIFT